MAFHTTIKIGYAMTAKIDCKHNHITIYQTNYQIINMKKITQSRLIQFGAEQFTYVNQIFGDLTIREIICEVYPSEHYELVALDDPEYDYHHVVIDKQTATKICSFERGYQDTVSNKNDCLCQMYSLLTYFDMQISTDSETNQKNMILMLRRILQNNEFITKIDEILLDPDNEKLWEITRTFKKNDKKYYVKMDKLKLFAKINRVLDDWNAFGFNYFIGEGDIVMAG
jgi:hypothetical protein